MKKVLFIEDEKDLHRSIDELFSSEGIEVMSAYDGESGLKRAETELPDLILLDIVLPKKDGFAVLEELKSHPVLKSTPVIVLTNLEGERDIERVMKLGAEEYLVKANHSLQDVFRRVRRVLSSGGNAR